MRAVFICAFLLCARTGFADSAQDFDALYSTALASCGGRIYAACDNLVGPNQQTLFEASVVAAKATGRKVLVLVGADWCPPCQIVDRTFKADPVAVEALKKDFVLVHIEATKITGHKVRMLVGAVDNGIPQAVFYDPATDQVSEAFNPGALSVGELRAATKEHPIQWPANH